MSREPTRDDDQGCNEERAAARPASAWAPKPGALPGLSARNPPRGICSRVSPRYCLPRASSSVGDLYCGFPAMSPELLPRESDEVDRLAFEIGRCWVEIERGMKKAAEIEAFIAGHKARLNQLLADVRSKLMEEGR